MFSPRLQRAIKAGMIRIEEKRKIARIYPPSPDTNPTTLQWLQILLDTWLCLRELRQLGYKIKPEEIA